MFRTVITPRVSETDGVGHINNTFIPVWLEAGRNELFKIFNPDHSFDNWRMVIIKSTVNYKNQIYFGLDAEVKVWVKKIGNSSLELYEEIWQNDTLCVTSETVYVNFNKQLGKSEPISDVIREELAIHYYKDGKNNEE
ncbi:acyl-CoA thioesterase [Oceanobacillus sp. CAU 1775]